MNPEDTYSAYQDFCQKIKAKPASREKYEQVNSGIHPMDLSVYSVPRYMDSGNPFRRLKDAP